ncbi:hypothetical protein [Rhizobium leguminosarum]|uniref:hypothetical protein n=1 Tax=Rhizobium leguminosarum TaxID=384 RepID=UPI00048634BD|nr:hypothetical protein [Rhizobium leguminosarum]
MMTREQLQLLMEMREELGNLGTYIKVKNSGARSKKKALADYDGKGKVFEGFLMLRLKASFEAIGAGTSINNSHGQDVKRLVIRGAPGKLRRRSDGEATFITVSVGGRTIEIHNSLVWPDHMVDGQGHEIDIAAATKEVCDHLAAWHERGYSRTRSEFHYARLPRPLMGIEAKFRGDRPDRELGRSITGLAVLVQMRLLYLISLARASTPILEQIRALTGHFAGSVLHSRAYHVTLEGTKIDTLFMDEVARQIERN